MMKRLALVLVLLCGSGCAESPAFIQPAYVSTMAYNQFDCHQLELEQTSVQTDLFMTSMTQAQTRFEDSWSMMALLLPLASMGGGNIAPQVAMDKGRLNAIRDEIIIQKCDFRRPLTGI